MIFILNNMLIDTHEHIVAEAVWCYKQSLVAHNHNAIRYEQCLLSLIAEMTDDEKRQYDILVS